jgi:hypothetical protein
MIIMAALNGKEGKNATAIFSMKINFTVVENKKIVNM